MDLIRLAATAVAAAATAYAGASIAFGAAAGAAEPKIQASLADKNHPQQSQSTESEHANRELADIPEYDYEKRYCEVYLYTEPPTILDEINMETTCHWALLFIFVDDGSVRLLEGLRDKGIIKATVRKEEPVYGTSSKSRFLGKIRTSPFELRTHALRNPLNGKEYCAATRNCQNWVKELANSLGGNIKEEINKAWTLFEYNPLFAISYSLTNKASSASRPSYENTNFDNSSTAISRFSYQDNSFDNKPTTTSKFSCQNKDFDNKVASVPRYSYQDKSLDGKDSLASSNDRSADLPEYETIIRECEIYLFSKSLKEMAEVNWKTVCHWALLFIFEDGVIRLLQGLRDEKGILNAYILKQRPVKAAGSKCYHIGTTQNSPHNLQLLAKKNMLNNRIYDTVTANCQEWIKEFAKYLDGKIERKITGFFQLYKNDPKFAVSLCFENETVTNAALCYEKKSAEIKEYDKISRECEIYLSLKKSVTENQNYIYDWALLFAFKDGTSRLLEGIPNKNGKLRPYILKEEPAQDASFECHHVGGFFTSPFGLRSLALQNLLNNQKFTTSRNWVREIGKCLGENTEKEINKILTFIPDQKSTTVNKSSSISGLSFHGLKKTKRKNKKKLH